MNPTDAQSAAASLCAQCGMCCNGVMFHTVWLQPGESPQKLAALGLKLKCKKKQHYLLQPCHAHNGSGCSVYAQRPERCRIFECRQLKRLAAGTITAAMALEKILDAKRRVAEITALLERAGPTSVTQPLAKRCERIAAEPPDPADVEAVELRRRLAEAFGALDALLDADFRVPKGEEKS